MYTILLCKVTIFAFNCKMKATIFLFKLRVESSLDFVIDYNKKYVSANNF